MHQYHTIQPAAPTTYSIKQILYDIFNLHGEIEPHLILSGSVGIVVPYLGRTGRRNPIVTGVRHVIRTDRSYVEVLIIRLFSRAEADRSFGVSVWGRRGSGQVGRCFGLVDVSKIDNENGIVPSIRSARAVISKDY